MIQILPPLIIEFSKNKNTNLLMSIFYKKPNGRRSLKIGKGERKREVEDLKVK